jgi:phospholipid-binding lipoprotein MlaA
MLRTALTAGLGCVVLATASTAAAQAVDSAPVKPPPAAHDPFERLNRLLYRSNKRLDHAVIRPLAMGYQAVVPKPARRGIRNVLDNLGEPLTFVNDVLQLHPKRAGTTFARFTLNSTLGVGGLFDVATPMKLPVHYEDFGQTLGRWGVGPGPYLFIPLVGPSNLRDGFGRIADWQVTPLAIPSWQVTDTERLGVTALDAIDTRATLDPQITATEKTATDDYATVRSAYEQNRASEIADGQTKVEELPDFDSPPPPTTSDAPPPSTPPQGNEPHQS